jgi:hypothetical protein
MVVVWTAFCQDAIRRAVAQFEMKRALSVPKSAVHRERDGEASTKPKLNHAFGFVEAVRF